MSAFLGNCWCVTVQLHNQEKNPDLGFFCQTCLTEGPEESQQLCCLHLSLPFLFPAMQNLLKTSVFSVINDDCSDQRGNLWPLLCTVHFSLSVCVTSLPVMNSSPFLNTTEYIWLPKPLSTCEKSSSTEFHFLYLKAFPMCAV